MELKYDWKPWEQEGIKGSNCTFMELKSASKTF